MNIARSVVKSLQEWGANDLESAMLHACNAVDGAAAKKWPKLGPGARFKRILAENVVVLEAMGFPGVDLAGSRFVLRLRAGGKPREVKIEDVLYHVHRCAHGHGDQPLSGYELIPRSADGVQRFTVQVDKSMTIPSTMISALLMIAVLETPVAPEEVDPQWYLFCDFVNPEARIVCPIRDWWGQRESFYAEAAKHESVRVAMDFATNSSISAP